MKYKDANHKEPEASDETTYPRYFVAGPDSWTTKDPNNSPNIYLRIDEPGALAVQMENGERHPIGYPVTQHDINIGYLREVTLAELALCVTVI